MATPKKKKGLPVTQEELKPKPPVESAPAPDETSGIPKDTTESKEKLIDSAIDELNEEIDSNWDIAYDNEVEWIEEAKEDVEFKSGKQWSDEDKATLERQGRPCMTFNSIRPIIKLISGHFIQNSGRIQASPEGGEDQKFSQVADKVISHVDEVSSMGFNLGYQFTGGQTTGRTYMEFYIDYSNDPIFGELKSIYHGKPGVIFPDPRGESYDLNEDRQFLFKLVKKTKSELKDLYPKKIKEIDEIASDSENPEITAAGKEGGPNNYGSDKSRSATGMKVSSGPETEKATLRQWHVKEYWRVKFIDRFFVYYVDSGDLVKYDTQELADADIETRKTNFLNNGGSINDWTVVSKKRKRKEMWVAIRCGGIVLADDKSPFEPVYNGFPVFQYIADWTPEAEKSVDGIQGMVRGMKDAQREKNKARSSLMHIISTSANSGWIIDNDAMSNQEKLDLKNFGSTPGIVIQKKPSSTVQRIEPTPPPIAQQVREKAADDSFKETTGVNADLLAIDKNSNPSGKAIALRIRQAITILEPDFRNFRFTKKLIGTFIMRVVPTLFDVAKLKKVLGTQFLESEQIDDTFLKAFLIQIEDLKYNVKIAEQGDTKTLREETFEDLTNMMQSGMQIPFSVFAKFMNIPNKAEVLAEIDQYQKQQAANALALAQQKGGGKAPGSPAFPPQ